MSLSWTLWIVILAVGALNFLSRASFIAVFARWPMPSFLARALRYVPAAMLTAIVVPPILLVGVEPLEAALVTPKPIAGVVATLVAWRTRSVSATIVGGMLALWLTQWLMRRFLAA